jgi:ABC-type sugar transport system ATPase subunit
MLQNPLWENIVQVRSMALGRDGYFLRQARLRSRADDHIQRLQIKTPSALVTAGSLSGGNQQKVVLAKWLDANPNVMLLDDPTRGVDVGARAEIHELLRTAAAGGACVILRSTDLDEMVAACDRVLVFYGGQVCGEVSGPELTPSVLLRLMNTEASPSDPAVA